jgi:hypothetical protein
MIRSPSARLIGPEHSASVRQIVMRRSDRRNTRPQTRQCRELCFRRTPTLSQLDVLDHAGAAEHAAYPLDGARETEHGRDRKLAALGMGGAKVTETAVKVAPIEPGDLTDAAESRARFHLRPRVGQLATLRASLICDRKPR